MTVYLVDSDYYTLKSYEKELSAAFPCIQLQCFTGCKPLLQAAETQKPDVVFLEMELPESITAAGALRRQKVRNLIMVASDSSLALTAFNIGASGYMMKPVTAEKMLDQMRHLKQDVNRSFWQMAKPSRTV